MVARYRVLEYRLPSPPSIKCNVLHESLSEDSQNFPCAMLKRRGSWVISIYLWLKASSFFCIKKDILGRKKDDQRQTIRWFLLDGVIIWPFRLCLLKMGLYYSVTKFIISPCDDEKTTFFAVERRRRYNINDRIKELGTLLPKEEDQ